jgi:alpha-beta hydrolase superfamily lysophospholipase
VNTALTAVASQATTTPFTTYDGHTLVMYDWPLDASESPRAMVLLVHGLGEHAWRYRRLAATLNAAGFAVRSYDQRGHGESSGARGCVPCTDALVKDLAEVVDETRDRLDKHQPLPLIVLGHSMGGLVSALWVARSQQDLSRELLPVQALVLSSPALQTDLNLWQRGVLATLPRWLPDITFSNGLDVNGLSHEPDVVAAYREDPLVHDRLSPRLGQFLANGGAEVQAHALQWRVPTLLMYAGSDLLVNPQGSRRFAQRTPVGVVDAVHLEDFFHEIFNDTHRLEAVEHLLNWLSDRF